MKSKHKALLLTLCAVLLVAATALGTLAYLTDTEAVTNTFTIGKVALGEGSQKGLDETKVNEYGEPVEGAARVQRNEYKLIPGHEYTKDPTVHVKKDSEDSYIFVKVENGIANIEAAEESTDNGYKKIATQITNNGWNALSTDSGNNIFWKKWEKGTDTTGTTDWEVFHAFKIDGDNVDADDLTNYQNKKIVVTAYAIQAAGFDNAAAAWTAGDFQ